MKELKPGTTFAAILGRVLAHHRERAGLDQKEIAKRMNIGQSAWSRIERGDTVINVEQLRNVATALGARSSDLIREAEEAAFMLSARDVQIESSKAMKNENNAVALIGLAALTTLVFTALSKK